MCQGDEGENRTHLDQNSLILGTIRTCPPTHTKKKTQSKDNKTKPKHSKMQDKAFASLDT